jgi:hypothetical protein
MNAINIFIAVHPNRWLHSDMKDVAYFYIRTLFDETVTEGELK